MRGSIRARGMLGNAIFHSRRSYFALRLAVVCRWISDVLRKSQQDQAICQMPSAECAILAVERTIESKILVLK